MCGADCQIESGRKDRNRLVRRRSAGWPDRKCGEECLCCLRNLHDVRNLWRRRGSSAINRQGDSIGLCKWTWRFSEDNRLWNRGWRRKWFDRMRFGIQERCRFGRETLEGFSYDRNRRNRDVCEFSSVSYYEEMMKIFTNVARSKNPDTS